VVRGSTGPVRAVTDLRKAVSKNPTAIARDFVA
jgi:hypothetical protein